MALLSVTKENSVVALAAVAWLAARTRSTRAATLAITGVAVTAPVSVLLGPSLRETIAFAENDFQRPSDSSWGFVVREYPAALWSMVHDDLFLPRLSFWTSSQAMLWYLAGTIVVLALILLLAKSTREDSFFRLMRATLLGAAAFMALAVLYSALRLELVFAPAVAVGFALLIDALSNSPLPRSRTPVSWHRFHHLRRTKANGNGALRRRRTDRAMLREISPFCHVSSTPLAAIRSR
jgi:hypothetical protein